VAREDANQEAIAVIRTRIDAWKEALAGNNDDDADHEHEEDEPSVSTDDEDDTEAATPDSNDVVLRSPTRAFTTSLRLQRDLAGHRPVFRDFDFKLKLFFKKWLPDEYRELGTGPIKVRIVFACA
jgi:hypothetical protein